MTINYYIVVCMDPAFPTSERKWVLATREVFWDYKAAQTYAQSVEDMREPLVVEGDFSKLAWPTLNKPRPETVIDDGFVLEDDSVIQIAKGTDSDASLKFDDPAEADGYATGPDVDIDPEAADLTDPPLHVATPYEVAYVLQQLAHALGLFIARPTTTNAKYLKSACDCIGEQDWERFAPKTKTYDDDQPMKLGDVPEETKP